MIQLLCETITHMYIIFNSYASTYTHMHVSHIPITGMQQFTSPCITIQGNYHHTKNRLLIYFLGMCNILCMKLAPSLTHSKCYLPTMGASSAGCCRGASYDPPCLGVSRVNLYVLFVFVPLFTLYLS